MRCRELIPDRFAGDCALTDSAQLPSTGVQSPMTQKSAGPARDRGARQETSSAKRNDPANIATPANARDQDDQPYKLAKAKLTLLETLLGAPRMRGLPMAVLVRLATEYVNTAEYLETGRLIAWPALKTLAEYLRASRSGIQRLSMPASSRAIARSCSESTDEYDQQNRAAQGQRGHRPIGAQGRAAGTADLRELRALLRGRRFAPQVHATT